MLIPFSFKLFRDVEHPWQKIVRTLKVMVVKQVKCDKIMINFEQIYVTEILMQ